ncbi:MAG: sigma-54 dependent transcriptional regulator [Rickettsiales bacterium]|nr:sigma-54 dependent transcriptional regulator [Rickettsiales bacterium]
MSYHILVVDDDPFQLKTIQLTIQKILNYKVTAVNSGEEAIDLLLSPKGAEINLVILDMQMPKGLSGFDVLDKICPIKPDLPIIMNTAHADVSKAVEALKKGAIDFLDKKDGPERMKVSIENVRLLSGLNKQVKKLTSFANNKFDFTDIIGDSRAIKKAINVAYKACGSNIPVLISGENGCGKELFARAIHSNSLRKNAPFIAVNCAAIPQNLIESTLFGHEKGSFTGAIDKNAGKFREADGGTIFLDEIGELSLEAQSKLLRVLQNFEIEPVGANSPIKVDVRVISATNKNLEEEVREGRFREDLLYRINVYPVQVPALRERREDIPLLLKHFIDKICTKENRKILDCDAKLVDVLSEYWWPGNIRQFENAIFRAIILSDGNRLKIEDFETILSAISNNYVKNSSSNNSIANNNPQQEISEIVGTLSNGSGKFKSMIEYEKDIIEQVLHFYNNNISKVSKVLGIGRSTLYRKMKEYGLDEGIIEEISEFRKEIGE